MHLHMGMFCHVAGNRVHDHAVLCKCCACSVHCMNPPYLTKRAPPVRQAASRALLACCLSGLRCCGPLRCAKAALLACLRVPRPLQLALHAQIAVRMGHARAHDHSQSVCVFDVTLHDRQRGGPHKAPSPPSTVSVQRPALRGAQRHTTARRRTQPLPATAAAARRRRLPLKPPILAAAGTLRTS